MKNLILLVTTGLLVLAFPVLVSAEDISAGQQQQGQQSQGQNASSSVSVGTFNGFGGFDFSWPVDGDFVSGTSVNVSNNLSQSQQQQMQQQQQINIGNGAGNGNGQTQTQTQDQNGQTQTQNQNGQNQSQSQNQNGQQQQQQQQIAKAVAGTPATKSGTLPSAGVEVAIPGVLATLGTSIAAYLKQKKQMASLAFLK